MADPTPTPEPGPVPAPPIPQPDPAPATGLARFVPKNWQVIVGWLAVAGVLWFVNGVIRKGKDPLPIPEPPVPVFMKPPDGWQAPTEAERQSTLAALRHGRFRDTPAGAAGPVADADYLTYRLAFKGRGKPIPDKDQGQIGDCVSMGFTTATEVTMAAQAAIGKQRQDLPDLATEAVYGGSRVNANGGLPPDMRGQDGSMGAWAAKWMETVGGAIPRGKYPSVDLSAYSVQLSHDWGDAGVPADILALCQPHKARCTMVTTADEAKAALAQGYAIAVCSDVGFESMTRDANGFIRPSGSWGHCMAIIAYRADRPGFLIWNSWGSNWCKGPKGPYQDIPDGSFWADAATVGRMLGQQDSYAVANADGFKKRNIQPSDWVVRARPDRRRQPPIALGVWDANLALAP